MYNSYHYVYRISNITENIHYYGVRNSKVHPHDDIGVIYFSSSSNANFINDQKKNPLNYKYKVIKICNDRTSAISLEIKLHNRFNVGANESFYNRAKQTSTGWDTTDTRWKMSDHGRNNISQSIIARGGYHGKNNPRFGSTLTDETKAKISISLLTSEYSDSTETRIKKSLSSKIRADKCKSQISIFNKFGDLITVCRGVDGLLEYCKINNLPGSTLASSYRRKGEPIYKSTNKNVLTRLHNNGFINFIGWYARCSDV